MRTLRDIVKQTWCRIVHGHVMVKIDAVANNNTFWVCSYCVRCEALYTII